MGNLASACFGNWDMYEHAGSDLAAAPPTYKGTRVVFLDVDGVLHPMVTSLATSFRKDRMVELKRVLDETGAHIVLSSAWRLETGHMEMVAKALQRHGCSPITSSTKDFRPGGKTRVQEILDWVKRHPGLESWVVLDDDDLMSMPQSEQIKARFVRTGRMDGLRRDGSSLAIRVLKGEAEATGRVMAGLDVDIDIDETGGTQAAVVANRVGGAGDGAEGLVGKEEGARAAAGEPPASTA